MIQVKATSTARQPQDGQYILVARQWPALLVQQQVAETVILADNAAPSVALEQWLAQLDALQNMAQPFLAAQQQQYRQAYVKELARQPENWLWLLDIARKGTLTLLYATGSAQFNAALLLAEFLADELDKWQENSSPVCYAGLDRLS